MIESEFSFTLNLDEEDPHVKPLPYTLRRVKTGARKRHTLPDYYPLLHENFCVEVTDCVKRIDKLKSTELKIKYNHDLSRIFAWRDYKGLMRLQTELIRVQLGEPSAKTQQH